MVSVLDSGANGPGSGPGWKHCVLGQDTLLPWCLSPPRCINGYRQTAGGNPAMDWHPIHGGVKILLVASCQGNCDRVRPDGPLGSYADLTYGAQKIVKCRGGGGGGEFVKFDQCIRELKHLRF